MTYKLTPIIAREGTIKTEGSVIRWGSGHVGGIGYNRVWVCKGEDLIKADQKGNMDRGGCFVERKDKGDETHEKENMVC
jgi:hypothetical protein